LSSRFDVKTREIKASTIVAAHRLAKDLAVKAESLKELALTKADVGSETLEELHGLLNQASEILESLRRSDAAAAA
jgi:energy-converting hydrogenase A subunit M